MMNSTYTPIANLILWFSEKPRTKRWDALLAFDRVSANTLLLQQYIERFNSDSYLEPVNGTVALSSGKVAEIRNYIFDKPRLSFENSSLDQPARATLRIQGLGGVRFIWDVSGATKKLDSISYELPVNGDIHQSTVDIKDKSVSVRDRKVIIDIASGTNPLLKIGGVLEEKKKAGALITQQLGLEPPQVREYVLSELKGEEGDLFEPETVMLLTQPAPASQRRDAPNYGDGAVLAFVAMKGGTVGDRPSEQDPEWRYLLDPREDGHSAILILSNDFFISKFVRRNLIGGGSSSEASSDFSKVKFVRAEDGGWVYLTAKEGDLKFGWSLYSENVQPVKLAGDLALSLSETDIFHVAIRDFKLLIEWSGRGRLNGGIYDLDENWIGGADSLVEYEASSRSSLLVDENSGLVSFWAWRTGSLLNLHPLWLEYGGPEVASRMKASLFYVFDSLFKAKINAAQLSNIVLAGDRPINLKGAELPGDMVMYGNVSETLTGLELNQVEVMVGAKNTFEFKSNASGDVTWAIELVDGEAENAGSVSDKGLYTAPELTSAYARVRLTATQGDRITHALITVVRELAAVSPAIQLAVAGSNALYYVRGGAAGAWEWDSTGLKGELKTPVPGPGDEFEPGDMQYVPPATFEGDYLVEEIKVKVGNNISTSKIVVTKGSALDVTAKLNQAGTSATLSASASGQAVEAVFTKVAGSGELKDKVVSTDASPAEPFIVVKAAMAGLPFMGYLLLPMPLDVLQGTESEKMLKEPTRAFTFTLDPAADAAGEALV